MSILRALVFAASVAVSQCRQNERQGQPHIIFMLVDDLGESCGGVRGALCCSAQEELA